MKISCANPTAQFESHKEEIESAVLRVMRSNRYILGDEVEALEQEFASYIGVSAAIGVANGTDALEIAIRALGIDFGDEIITVSHTAVATVAAIEAAGALPVLIDVDPKTFTINVQQLESVLSTKTKAIIAVHLYGQSADLDLIKAFCRKNDLWLIEDVSQAHGATWKGKRLGSIGDIACFSCYPTKNLGALGDAGLITTNNIELAKRVRMIREYGWANRYVSDLVGRNSRLDEVQAAILRVKLRYLDSDNNKRRKIAACYAQGLKSLPIDLPIINPNCESVYHLYVIKTKFRDSLKAYLAQKDIETIIHYPLPIHLQPAYKNRIKTFERLEVTKNLSDEVLSLPMYPELNSSSVERVISEVKNFYDWQSKQ
jgi:dTDP-4-amino-4,6-dideoxygalactose transaminase